MEGNPRVNRGPKVMPGLLRQTGRCLNEAHAGDDAFAEAVLALADQHLSGYLRLGDVEHSPWRGSRPLLLASFDRVRIANSDRDVTVAALSDERLFAVTMLPATFWHPVRICGVGITDLNPQWDALNPVGFEWRLQPSWPLRPPVETHRWLYAPDDLEIELGVTKTPRRPQCVGSNQTISAYGIAKPVPVLRGRVQRFASIETAHAELYQQLAASVNVSARPVQARLWWGP
jgi:hypothetical protein